MLISKDQEKLQSYVDAQQDIEKITKYGIYLILNNEEIETSNFTEKNGKIILSEIKKHIQNNDKFKETDDLDKLNLLKICSQIEISIALLNEKEETKTISKKNILKNKLIAGANKKDYDKIDEAMNILYPKSGENSTKRIAGVNNLMYLFNNNNIIQILENMKVLAYTEIPKNETMEKSMLDGTSIRKHYFVSDDKLSGMFISGHDSIQGLYQLFDIEIPPYIKKDLETTKKKFQLKNNLEEAETVANTMENKIQNIVKDENKFNKLKEKFKQLQKENDDIKKLYKEEQLDMLAKFEKTNDNSVFIKSLLNERSFLNWFKGKTIPTYLTQILQKVQKNKELEDTDIFSLYIYFAQHYYITKSSIEPIIENLKEIGIDINKIDSKNKDTNLNLFDIMEIIANAPNYINQVDSKNRETLQTFEKENDISMNKILFGLRPLYLQSKGFFSKKLEKVYTLYETALNRSDKKDIKDHFSKWDLKIRNITETLNSQKIIDALITVEPITDLKRTLKQFVLIKKKIEFVEEKINNKPFTEYSQSEELQGNEGFNDFSYKSNTGKNEIQKNIKNNIPLNIQLKGNYKLTEDITSGIQEKGEEAKYDININGETAKKLGNKENFDFDLNEFLTKLDKTMITEEEKTLRKFVYESKEGSTILENIKEQYEAGIISKDLLDKIPNIIKLLSNFKNLDKSTNFIKKKVDSSLVIKVPGFDKDSQFSTKTYFNKTQEIDLEEIKKNINNLFKYRINSYKMDDLEGKFKEIKNYEGGKTDIFITYSNEFEAQTNMLNINETQKKYGITIKNALQIVEQYKRITEYKRTKDNAELMQQFENERKDIIKAMDKFNLPTENILEIINVLNNENHLIDQEFFDTLQSIVNLGVNPELLSPEEKQTYAKQMRIGYFSKFTDKKFPQLNNTQNYEAAKIDHKELFEEIQKSINHITNQINGYLNKNEKSKQIVHELTHRNNEERNNSENIKTQHIVDFLGKTSLSNFLLGHTKIYNIPTYMVEKIKQRKEYLQKIDNNYEQKIQEIIDFINQKRIYDKFLPQKENQDNEKNTKE